MPAPRIPRIPTYGRVPEIPTGLAVTPRTKPPAFAPGATPAVMRRTEPTRWLTPPPGAARLEQYTPHYCLPRHTGATPSLLAQPSAQSSAQPSVLLPRAAEAAAAVITLPARRR